MGKPETFPECGALLLYFPPMTAMQSPFPGMDPYLERHWLDVHQSLVTYTRDALNDLLPADLLARTEERVLIDADAGLIRAVHPDVRVQETGGGPSVAAAHAGAGIAVAEPIVLELESEPRTEGYITILDHATGDRLVSVIEFLSPTNKLPGEDRDAFRRKRAEMLSGGVNWVEVDLVRQGAWRDLLQPHVAPREVDAAYRATVRRGQQSRRVVLYPMPLKSALPSIPIPLRPADADVDLNLQELLARAYHNGRYANTDYSQPCDPPLQGEDAEWADRLLREAGKR